MVTRRRLSFACAVCCLAMAGHAGAQEPSTPPESRERLIQEVVRADYRGDRARLEELVAALPAADDEPAGALIRYWRGFAWWRRAINGFNETPSPVDLALDLSNAIKEFDLAVIIEPTLVDGVAGLLSCVQLQAYLHRESPQALQELAPKFRDLLERGQRLDASHPRFLWVAGQASWYSPPGTPADAVLRRQHAAIEMYERGLQSVKAATDSRPLAPTWGEPELLMNLAWSHLHAVKPDPTMARQYADRALRLVPDWHYLRDILMPQIRQELRRR